MSGTTRCRAQEEDSPAVVSCPAPTGPTPSAAACCQTSWAPSTYPSTTTTTTIVSSNNHLKLVNLSLREMWPSGAVASAPTRTIPRPWPVSSVAPSERSPASSLGPVITSPAGGSMIVHHLKEQPPVVTCLKEVLQVLLWTGLMATIWTMRRGWSSWGGGWGTLTGSGL